MARCAPRCCSYRRAALWGIAALNVVFLVILHTQRPSTDVYPVDLNIPFDSNHDKDRRNPSSDRSRRIAASQRSPLGQRNSNYGVISAGGESCSNLTKDMIGIPSKPEQMTEETFQWQTVTREQKETFVFSAYYDSRVSPAVVRIVGISSGKYVGNEKQTKHCQLWLANKRHPKVTVAEYNIVPETHDRSYAASLHTCRLENSDEIPYAVSLVYDDCQSPSNVLRVLNYNDPQSPEFNFTVCVTPLNFNYNNYHQLVEMVEVNRLFGAQQFVFYNYSTGGQLEPFLRWYEGRSVLRVIPWHLPVVVDVWPQDPKVEPEIHYFGQLAALNDCLYRNMPTSRFIVFTDLDELIVPRHQDTWSQMLSSISGTSKQQQQMNNRSSLIPGAFIFKNAFFPTDWNDRATGTYSNDSLAVKLNLNTLLKTKREDRIYPSFVRSKYIAVSKMVSMAGVHSVLNFIDDVKMTHVTVEEDEALLQHYRRGLDNADEITPIYDDRMQHFAKKIISAVNYVHSHVHSGNVQFK